MRVAPLGLGAWDLGFGICSTPAFTARRTRSARLSLSLTRTSAAATLTAGRAGTVPVLVLPLRGAVARAAEARRLSARLSWLVGTTHGAATVVVPLLPAATAAIGIEIAASAAARLTDRELRNLSLRRLTLRSRQRRANQPAVHGTVVIASVVRRSRVIVNAHIGALAVRLGLIARGGGGLHRRVVSPDYVLSDLFFVGHVDIGHRRAWTSGIGRLAREFFYRRLQVGMTLEIFARQSD